MKLLSKPELKSRLHKENEDLIETNQRLRKIYKEWLIKLNSVKNEYSKDKEREDFDRLCLEFGRKKSELLKELSDLQERVNGKREVVDELIEKQDEIQEREYRVKEMETKLNLRESFIKQVENKMYDGRK